MRDVDQRHREHRRVQRQRAEKLAEDDLQVGQRRREQQLDRSGPLLLRIGPHRDQRHQEQDQDRRVLEEQPDHLFVDVHRLGAAELARLHALPDEVAEQAGEEEAVEKRPQADHDVGDRRCEIRLAAPFARWRGC